GGECTGGERGKRSERGARLGHLGLLRPWRYAGRSAAPLALRPEPRALSAVRQASGPATKPAFRGDQEMKRSLRPGLSTVKRIAIDRDRTIGFMGEDARVYATP